MSTALPIDMRWERSTHRLIVTTEPFGPGDTRAIVCEVFSGGLGIEGADAAERLIAAAPELLRALASLEVLWPLDGEDANETFERVAALFHSETGYLRPGKDCRVHDIAEREAAWYVWLEAKRKAARAALAAAQGRSPQEAA